MTLRVFFVTAVAGLVGTAFCHCSLQISDPPFQYLPAVLVLGPVNDCHEIMGFHYGVRNLGTETITGLHLSFRLYDASGSPVPPSGDNTFDVEYSGEIAPHTESWICASLDSSLYFQPAGEFTVEGFRIYRVDIADGSSWSDSLGLFPYPYDVAIQTETSGT